MPTRIKAHNRAQPGLYEPRKRVTHNLPEEAEVALKLYALRMKLPKGRTRGVSLAIEHILYKSKDFTVLLPEAHRLMIDGTASRLRVYQPTGEQLEVIENIKRGTEHERNEGGAG